MTNTLNEQEQALVALILKEYADKGSSTKYTALFNEDWEEVPVDIETFLKDKQYLGNGLIDTEGRFTIFPFWVEKLKEIFPTNTTTAYNTLIFTGAIGLGKSMIACICLLYMLYRLLCLRDPYLYYGMQPIDKLSISFLNITIDAAKGVGGDKFNQLLLGSSWFMSHGEMHGTTNLEYVPNKHIEIVYGSSNNQIIGRALFCLDGDTVIKTEHGDVKLSLLCDELIRVWTLGTDGNYELSDYCTVKPTIKTDEEIVIELEDGTIIKCTPTHRFMLKDGSYKEAQYLTEDDELFDIYKAKFNV